MLVNSPLIGVEGYFRLRARRPGPRDVGLPEPGRRPGAIGRVPRLAHLPARAARARLPDRDARAPVQVADAPGGRRAARARGDDLPADRVFRVALTRPGRSRACQSWDTRSRARSTGRWPWRATRRAPSGPGSHSRSSRTTSTHGPTGRVRAR